LSGTVAATLNGASIYIESLRKPDQYQTEKGRPLKEDILHATLPAGPKGQFSNHLFHSHVIPNYSKNQAQAKALLKWFHTPANYEKWFVSFKGFNTAPTVVWEGHKMWDEDPVMTPFRAAAAAGRVPGFAGQSNQKAAEVLNKYIVVDMYAKAVQGMPAEQAAAWAEGELKKVYAAG
ncbi:MAG TPA: hypothetical protein VGC82_19280, partial [Rhodopila sp.]